MPENQDFCIRILDRASSYNCTASLYSNRTATLYCFQPLLCLTAVVAALKTFQDFEPDIRATAIAFSSELAAQHGWSQEVVKIHGHRIAAALLVKQEAV